MALPSPSAAATMAATGRLGAGLVMAARPSWLSRPLGVDAITARRTGWLPRMLGVREVVLGAGVLVALRHDHRTVGAQTARGWALAGALCDAADVINVSAALRRGDVPRLVGSAVVLTAASAVLLGAQAARGSTNP